MTKWQEEYVNRITVMALADLIEEVVERAPGDDYDGGFTKRGDWCFQFSKVHLSQRLFDGGVVNRQLFV